MRNLVIFIAQYLIIFPVLAAGYVFLREDRSNKLRMFVLLALTGGLALAAARIGHSLIYSPRPFMTDGVTPYFSHAPDNGFPSDHTLFATAVGLGLLTFKKWWAAAVLVSAVLIGGSRVIAGVHHGRDIIGAMLLSATGYLLARLITARWFKPLSDNQPKARKQLSR